MSGSAPQSTQANGPDYIIRRYTPSDLQELAAVFYDSVRKLGRRDYTLEQVIAWAPDDIDWEARARRHGSRPTWVAQSAGQVVGFADLEASGHIDLIFVRADWQGRGVASALLLEIERAAGGLGIERLFAEVSLTARPFFERRGFRVIARQSVAIRGQELANFRMEKSLKTTAAEAPGA